MSQEDNAPKRPDIGPGWYEPLAGEFQEPYFGALRAFLVAERERHTVYPPAKYIFNAFQTTPFQAVRVVILGQDPYHGPNQAHGLSFSVQRGIKLPPSLVNIYKELQDDLGIEPARHGNLTAWAKQGVFLLNTVLTVRDGEANSHRGKGWELLTDAVIRALNERQEPVVFILWGNASIAKKVFIDTTKHVVITSPHPSPLSSYRGFFGSKPFSKTNEALKSFGVEPIDWRLPE